MVVKVDQVSGYGEVGLPPKKPMCYLADFDDVKKYFNDLLQWIPHVIADPMAGDYDPFEALPAKYFASARNSAFLLWSISFAPHRCAL